jgi:hypothetical protein
MWQKCPICNGKGYINELLANGSSSTCPTCNGTRLISELTGNPPSELNSKTSTPYINHKGCIEYMEVNMQHVNTVPKEWEATYLLRTPSTNPILSPILSPIFDSNPKAFK